MHRTEHSTSHCPYCCKEAAFAFDAADWNQRTTTATFRYFRCEACSLVFIEEIPANLAQYYANEQYDIPADGAGFEQRASSQQWKVEMVRALVASGDLLEIGPATGEFAYAAREQGFKPTLIEMDERCCAFMEDVLRLDVRRSASPAEALPPGRRFDAVCIWQAIEHIPNFWSLLERLVAVLSAGGVLFISTPNPNSLQARMLGRRWPHLDAPRHLYLISQAWIRKFAQQHGLAVELDTTRDVGSLGLNYYGWYLAVRNTMGSKVSSSTVNAMARRISAMFRGWEKKEGRGCSYTIALRKKA